ncbi:MAG: hypothetical protein ABIA63_11965, partial [bacterium]
QEDWFHERPPMVHTLRKFHRMRTTPYFNNFKNLEKEKNHASQMAAEDIFGAVYDYRQYTGLR